MIVAAWASFSKLVVDERLEQLESHLLRQAALVKLELRTDDDNRTSRVIDTFSEQILTETSLFTFERSRKRFERTIVRTAKHAAAASVIEQSVNRFLQHALFVADDDFRSAKLDELLQTVVAVDDAAIEIVKIRRRKPSAVERHERAKLGRNDRDHVEDHPLGLLPERRNEFETFSRFGILELFLLRRFVAHLCTKLFDELGDVDLHAAGL